MWVILSYVVVLWHPMEAPSRGRLLQSIAITLLQRTHKLHQQSLSHDYGCTARALYSKSVLTPGFTTSSNDTMYFVYYFLFNEVLYWNRSSVSSVTHRLMCLVHRCRARDIVQRTKGLIAESFSVQNLTQDITPGFRRVRKDERLEFSLNNIRGKLIVFLILGVLLFVGRSTHLRHYPIDRTVLNLCEATDILDVGNQHNGDSIRKSMGFFPSIFQKYFRLLSC